MHRGKEGVETGQEIKAEYTNALKNTVCRLLGRLLELLLEVCTHKFELQSSLRGKKTSWISVKVEAQKRDRAAPSSQGFS